MSAESREEILTRLEHIERTEDVRVLYAIESGSRAWQFASTDSDWDCRFLYVRPVSWYLRPTWRYRPDDSRDVIERREGPWDLEGWDLAKACHLLANSNPTLVEWINSPRRYIDRDIRGALWAAALECIDARALQQHYWHMARQNFQNYIKGRSAVRLKKYLYVLRPLFALRQLETGNPFPSLDFMHVFRHAQRVEPRLEDPVCLEVRNLVARKQGGLEAGEADPIVLLDQWIGAELERQREVIGVRPALRPPLIERTDLLFRDTLKRMTETARWDPVERFSEVAELVVERCRRAAYAGCLTCKGEGLSDNEGTVCACARVGNP